MNFLKWLIIVASLSASCSKAKADNCQYGQSTTLNSPQYYMMNHVLKKDSVHSPKKAALLSAVLPGAGQFYNEKYWKIPIIYTAGAVGGYMIYTNYTTYADFRQAYINRNNGLPASQDNYQHLSSEQLKVYRDSYRRNTELAVILTTFAYIIQILDATVDGHLYGFKVSNEAILSAGALPFANYNGSFYCGNNLLPALTLKIKIP